MTEATETGAASHPDAKVLDGNTGTRKIPPGRAPELVDRDALLADMDAKIEAQRAAENTEFLQSSGHDPRAFLLAQQMEREAAGLPLDGEELPDTDVTPDTEDGAEFVEPVRTAPAAKTPAQRVSTKGEDPLGDFVIRVNGKPMFKTLVDGVEKLIPLEAARSQLQKHLAADIRLQQAASRNKALDTREAALKATEARLSSRPAPVPVDDSVMDNEAVEIVRSLVNEPEAQAAARLAKTLKTIRQAATPQIDVKAIVKQAGDEAVARIVARDNDKALALGFDTFTADYSDIAGDPELFAVADRKTDAIAAEHPEWSPEQVMSEAGNQTRAWMKQHGMTVKVPANGGQHPSNRQQRKEGLRPMPTTRTARPAAVVEQSASQSPSDAVAEMRKARGQA